MLKGEETVIRVLMGEGREKWHKISKIVLQ